MIRHFPLFLYKRTIRSISQRVILKIRNAWLGCRAMASVGLLVGGGFIAGAESGDQTRVIGYAHVQQPETLTDYLEDQPIEYSRNPFSIFILYRASQLYPVIAVPTESASAWDNLVSQKKWKTFSLDGWTFFVKEGSTLDAYDPGIRKIPGIQSTKDGQQSSAGLLPDANALWNLLFTDGDARDALWGTLLPQTADKPEIYRPYLQWWMEELTSLASMRLELVPEKEGASSTLSIQTVPGTRLFKLFNNTNRSKADIFNYVPAKASKLTLGQFDAATTTGYWNYFFKGTNLLDEVTFQRIRTGLNELDYGFFDLWDGNFALWTPGTNGDRILILGGRFVTTDLSDLFDVLSNVPLEGSGYSLELDRDNTVVGFTRVRSLEWKPEGKNKWLPDDWMNKRVYFASANGCLVISEDESHMIDLVFKLNGRQTVRNSALELSPELTGLSLAQYENGILTDSIQFSNGGLFQKQNQSRDTFGKLIVWLVNNLD